MYDKSIFLNFKPFFQILGVKYVAQFYYKRLYVTCSAFAEIHEFHFRVYCCNTESVYRIGELV